MHRSCQSYVFTIYYYTKPNEHSLSGYYRHHQRHFWAPQIFEKWTRAIFPYSSRRIVEEPRVEWILSQLILRLCKTLKLVFDRLREFDRRNTSFDIEVHLFNGDFIRWISANSLEDTRFEGLSKKKNNNTTPFTHLCYTYLNGAGFSATYAAIPWLKSREYVCIFKNQRESGTSLTSRLSVSRSLVDRRLRCSRAVGRKCVHINHK